MTGTTVVYRSIDSVLSSAERSDRVLSACFEGDVDRARRLLVPGDDPDSLLAHGVVAYWLARTRTEFTYEQAKDLLSKASRLFLQAGNVDRSLLADIWIGLSYWRLGQMSEAIVMVTCSTKADDPHVRFLALVNQSVLETESKQWQQGLKTLEIARDLFDAETSLSWRGRFFQQRGLCYKLGFEESHKQDYLDRALMDYESASEHYERAGNIRFEAAILNNVANLYRVNGQLERANNNADRSMRLYERIGDRSNLAQAKDTKALILLDKGDTTRAKKYADQAVALLRKYDPGWLTSVLVTRARVNFQTGLTSVAQADYKEAATIAESAGDYDKAAEVYLDEAETFAGVFSVHAQVDLLTRVNELSPSRPMRVALKVLNNASVPDLRSLDDLKTAERKQEHEVILRELEKATGSVTKAARALGKTHGGLTHIIKTRHPDLTKYCRPIIRRRRSAVKSTGR